jgi:hypothetical protein
MVEKFAAETQSLKLHRIVDLKAALDRIENLYGTGFTEQSHSEYKDVLLTVVKKVASGSCSHPPTWSKELLKSADYIGYFDR